MSEKAESNISRRDFIKISGAIVFVAGTGIPLFARDKISPSDGYLLVDIEKCQGCASCMLACSLIHEGVESLSLSRIQMIQNPFESFPDDVAIAQCRQCEDPACVHACPTGALAPHPGFGNVRMVEKNRCIGCGSCFEACPFTPSRAFLSTADEYGGDLKSRKCDLCANARFHWNARGGSPDGMKACEEVCPVGAIKFTKKMPRQKGDRGYQVDLRGRTWKKLGYPKN